MARNKSGIVDVCPYCSSENVLPFEDDSREQSDLPVVIIILTALAILALYFAFVLTSYMYFPLVVFIAIILTTRVINRQDKSGKQMIIKAKGEFICLNCNTSFSRSEDGRSVGP